MSFGVGCRLGLDPSLLWLWRRPVATPPIRPLAWEPSYAVTAAQEMAKRQKKKKKKRLLYTKAKIYVHIKIIYKLTNVYKTTMKEI